MRFRGGGFSLVEVLVSAGIASVLLTVVAALLVMISRSYEEQRERAGLATELLNAREDLYRHLAGAPDPLLPTSAEVVTATFLSGGAPKYSNGAPLWQSFVGYRREGAQLVRLGQSFTPSVVCPALPANLASLPTAARVVVARNVSNLSFARDGSLLKATLTVRRDSTTLEGRYSFLLQEALL